METQAANAVVLYLLGMHDTVRLYHWQTFSHPRHKATCRFLSELLPLIDKLVETFIGRYDRPDFGGALQLEIPELTDEAAAEQLRLYGRWLKNDFPRYVQPRDTDLLNLRDEVLAAVHQTMYRFTLR